MLLFAVIMHAQDGDKAALQIIDPSNFNEKMFTEIIAEQLQNKRFAKNKESLVYDSLLTAAAANQTAFCVKQHKSSTKQSGKYEKTPSRLGLVGANENAMAAEIVFDVKWSKKGNHFTYGKVARDVIKKIRKTKYDKILLNDQYYFTGYDFALDQESGKMFVSIVVADIEALNNGFAHLDELTVSFTPKYKYGIEKGKNLKIAWMGLFAKKDTCSFIDQALINKLTFNALYVDGNKVKLKKDYISDFKSLLINSNDALVVDVVSKDQFPTDTYYNITDRSTFTTGFLLKPVYGKNIESDSTNDIVLGMLPAVLSSPVNFNLFVYKSKHCHDGYSQSEWINNDSFSNLYQAYKPTSLALNYDTAGTTLPTFSAKENKIEFTFPFEQGKFNFKKADIQPLIDSLGEPSFIINKVNIEAYSSIEGDSLINDKLQKRRSGNIVGVLEKMNENVKIPYTVNTNTGWSIFKNQVKGTQWQNFADSSIAFVNDTLYQDRALLDSLEPLLAKQRYAKVQLYVTYKEPDLDENEYFLFKYQKAIKQGRVRDALALQNELIKNGIKNQLLQIEVPLTKNFASLHNNLLCMKAEQIENMQDLDNLTTLASNLYEKFDGHSVLRFNYAALVLYGLKVKDFSTTDLEKYLAIWSAIEGQIQMTQIINADEVTRMKTKFNYYKSLTLDQFPDDKKSNKKLLETVKNLRDLEDVLAFSDLFASKGNKTAAYTLLYSNFEKFNVQLQQPVTQQQKEIAAQYAIRMIPYFKNIDAEDRYIFEARVFKILNGGDAQLLRKLFEENILSFQYFDNLWIKQYYKSAIKVKDQSIGL